MVHSGVSRYYRLRGGVDTMEREWVKGGKVMGKLSGMAQGSEMGERREKMMR